MARTDPVTEAEQRYAAAAADEQAAKDALAALEARIADGDLEITAEQHGQAEHAKRRAELIAQGAKTALDNARISARLDRLAAIREDIEKDAGNAAEIIALNKQTIEAIAELIRALATRLQSLKAHAVALAAEGVPPIDKIGKARIDPAGHVHEPYHAPTPEHGNLGHSQDHTGARALYIENRVIDNIPYADLIEADLYLAAKLAGQHPGKLRAINVAHPKKEITDDIEGWLNARI